MNISNDYFFNEIFGCYYTTVMKLISIAAKGDLSKEKVLEVINGNSSFSKKFRTSMRSNFTKLPFVEEVVGKDGRITYETNIEHVTERPISLLEKRWLKSILSDPRIALFDEEFRYELEGIEPLFQKDDFKIVGKYMSGDDFSNPEYVRCFRTILKAIREGFALKIRSKNSFGKASKYPFIFIPDYLEYSDMEDKFSVYGYSTNQHYNRIIINVGRIISCELYSMPRGIDKPALYEEDFDTLKVWLDGESLKRMDTLERMLIEFSGYKKRVTETEDSNYIIEIEYRKREEKEMLVMHLMQFAHSIRIIEPESVQKEIRTRLLNQKKLFSDIL